MTLKAIKVKDPLNVKGIEKAIQNALNAAAKGAKADFGVTTQTWVNKPEFTIDDSQPDRRIVGTDDKIYGFVDKGTRPHIIRPKRPGGKLTWMGTNYKAKTAPMVIKSTRSSNNNTIVYAKVVQHPGNAPRKFTLVIRDKWAKQMKIQMQAAIVAAMKPGMVSL